MKLSEEKNSGLSRFNRSKEGKAVLVGHEAKETHKQRAKDRKKHRTEDSWVTLSKNVLRDDYTRFKLRHLFPTYTPLVSRTITTKSKFSYGTEFAYSKLVLFPEGRDTVANQSG